MSAPVLNVVRYGALVSGIAYGVVHHRTLQAKYDDKMNVNRTLHRQELIQSAKKAFADEKRAKTSTGPISDPEDPKFDFEAWLNWATGEKAAH